MEISMSKNADEQKAGLLKILQHAIFIGSLKIKILLHSKKYVIKKFWHFHKYQNFHK